MSALSSLLLTGVAAQTFEPLTGTVVDPQDAPVPAIYISLVRSGFKRQTQTSAVGGFRFDLVPPADYEL